MSELNDKPANELDLSYTVWRQMILNMFLEEDHEMFLEISDPEYLKNNLEYHHSKSVDCQMMNLDGQFIWVKLIFNRVDTGNPDDFKFLFMVEDIHESHMQLMEDLKKFETLATTDSLTQVANHGAVESYIQNSIEKCRNDNKPISIIMFDIDHFKRVNDTYGHAVGDYVLKTLAEISSELLIKYGGVMGRWGGEEFIAVCEDTDIEKIATIAEELRILISEYKFDTVGTVTSSFGIIQVKDDETHLDAFKRVDNALYFAKNTGRNRVSKN